MFPPVFHRMMKIHMASLTWIKFAPLMSLLQLYSASTIILPHYLLCNTSMSWLYGSKGKFFHSQLFPWINRAISINTEPEIAQKCPVPSVPTQVMGIFSRLDNCFPFYMVLVLISINTFSLILSILAQATLHISFLILLSALEWWVIIWWRLWDKPR